VLKQLIPPILILAVLTGCSGLLLDALSGSEYSDPALAESTLDPVLGQASPIEDLLLPLTQAIPGLGLLSPLLLLSRRFRKASGKVIRTVSGNSAPKKWVTELYERVNDLEARLEPPDDRPGS
jgi:hypothetical protein